MSKTEWVEYECDDCGKRAAIYAGDEKPLERIKRWKVDVNTGDALCRDCNKKREEKEG